MVMSVMLISLTALLTFCFCATCREILRRQVDHEFFFAVVNANRLEFSFSVQSLGAARLTRGLSPLSDAIKVRFHRSDLPAQVRV